MKTETKKESWVAIFISNKEDFKTKPISRVKEGLSNPTSKCLFEQTQSTISKKYVNPNVHDSIIYKSQYMKLTSVSINE